MSIPSRRLPTPSQTFSAVLTSRCDQWGKGHHSEPWRLPQRHRLTHQVDLSPVPSGIPAPQPSYGTTTPVGPGQTGVTQANEPLDPQSQQSPVHTVTRAGRLWGPYVWGWSCCYLSMDDVWRSRTPVWATSPGRTRRGTRPGLGAGHGSHPPRGLLPPQRSGARAGRQGSGLRGGGSESASRAQHMSRSTFGVSSVPWCL